MLTKILTYDAVVVGTGASGYNAACLLKEKGVNVAIVTENVNYGTSRNAGSDKQTYYKLSVAGKEKDSVREMAEDLFSCGAVDGDNALCEAALSVPCFMRLAAIGVEFPKGRYGEYIGYKTDHDPKARASSAGPLTSKMMTEALQKEAKRLKIPVYNRFYAAEILKNENNVCGLICINKGKPVIFRTVNIILATGGPAGIYSRSVYPESQHGSTGLALLAGATLQNITEWQFGLASVNPRWNVSGTYMQALPCVVFRYPDGKENEKIFETESEKYDFLSLLFLKGYQWPFDCEKAKKGSSQIDLMIEDAISDGCRVFLDYRKNPFDIEKIDFERLSGEAYDYLSSVGACFGRPIDRLKKMNMPAYNFFLDHGTDLEKDMLEISVCVQHCNGGISVDSNWQTNIKGLFAVGECAGTHGIKRPGGSALNAGQVGSLRAAEYIANKKTVYTDTDDIFYKAVKKYNEFTSGKNYNRNIAVLKKIMSENCGICRTVDGLERTVEYAEKCVNDAFSGNGRTPVERYKNLNDAISALAVAAAMLEYCREYGTSRGSAFITGEKISDDKKCTLSENIPGKDEIYTVSYNEKKVNIQKRKVRPIPPEEDAFENVWKEYRKNKNIYD